MPKTDASIALSLQDNMSASIKKVQSSLSVFGTDVDGLQKRLDALNKTKFELKTVNLKKAKEELDSAKKALEALGDAATETERDTAKTRFDKATQNYENLRNQLDLLSRQAKQTKKDMLDAADSMSKADNRAASSGLLQSLSQAGLFNMLGDSIGTASNAIIGSALGSSAGNMVSSVLGSAASGAAIGSLAGLPGMLIGAGVGAIAGGISGLTENFENEDEAFKSYYNDLYDSVTESHAQSLTEGSSVAAQREQDAIAFNQLLGAGVGDQYLEDLRALAANTPMEYEDLTAMSRALATGFGDSPERMLELMTAIGDAGSAVGVTAADMAILAEAMSRMESSDKAALEYLNIFQDRGIDVIGMLAKSIGTSTGGVYDMISKGQISGGYAVDVIQKGMETAFSGAMEEMSRTFDGLTSTLSDTMTEIDNARGEAYNEERSKGLQANIDAYGGSLGQAMEHLASLTGGNQAYMENLADQYLREAYDAVLTGAQTSLYTQDQQADLEALRSDYLDNLYKAEHGDQDAKLELDNLEKQIEAYATMSYEASDQYKKVVETEEDLMTFIGANTKSLDSWRTKFEFSMNRTVGLMGFTDLATQTDKEVEEAGGYQIYSGGGPVPVGEMTIMNGSNAYGLKRVPYDNYVALLHQGERVLTASEARAADSSAARPVTVTFSGPITINQDSDIDTLAGKLADAIELAMKAGVR